MPVLRKALQLQGTEQSFAFQPNLQGHIEKLTRLLREAESSVERMEQAQRTRLEGLVSTASQVGCETQPYRLSGGKGTTCNVNIYLFPYGARRTSRGRGFEWAFVARSQHAFHFLPTHSKGTPYCRYDIAL